MAKLGRLNCMAYHAKAAPWHTPEELERDYDDNLSQHGWDAGAHAVVAEVARPFSRADEADWEHLDKLLGESAHGKFWREILKDFRSILREEC